MKKKERGRGRGRGMANRLKYSWRLQLEKDYAPNEVALVAHIFEKWQARLCKVVKQMQGRSKGKGRPLSSLPKALF